MIQPFLLPGFNIDNILGKNDSPEAESSHPDSRPTSFSNQPLPTPPFSQDLLELIQQRFLSQVQQSAVDNQALTNGLLQLYQRNLLLPTAHPSFNQLSQQHQQMLQHQFLQQQQQQLAAAAGMSQAPHPQPHFTQKWHLN